MSIEYTIDIQLTELGFPDILEPRDSPARETPRHSSSSSDDSFSPSHSTDSLSAARKKRLLLRGRQSAQGEEAGAAKQISNDETVCCKASSPAQADEAALLQPSESTALTAGPETTDLPQGDGTEEGVGDGDGSVVVELDDSDDSEVSEVYEEEEDDEEEDEDEEGPNNESSHSGVYHCSMCNLLLPSKFKLQDHMNLHAGVRPYCCAECGKRFCQIYNYRVHLRTHAQTKVDRLVCRVCMQGFKSEKALKDHVSRSHLEDKFYECDLCKRVFTSLKDCEFHVQLHKYMLDVKCEVCGRNFSSSKSLARHKKKACSRNFKCTDCTKTFTKKTALLKHSFSHLGLLPYTCVRCRCHFRLARLYRQHKCEPERIHCVACLREFLSQEDFQQHKKDTGCWGNQEPKGDEIRCLECGERFDTTEELKKHAGAHQRVLKCAECGKGFRSALLLMSHMGGHAGKSPCLCQSCGLGFPHQQNYDSHLKTCGQTRQPASAPKKRRVSKSSSPDTQKLNAKPESSTNPTNTVTKPTNTVAEPTNPVAEPTNPVAEPTNPVAEPTNPVTKPTTVTKSAAPVKARHSPGPEAEGVSADSGSADGLWKLTLDKQPPPGVKLVFFLPVCPTQSNGLPPAVSPTLSGPAMQVQPQHLRVNASLGVPLNAPLDLVKGIKEDPEHEAPLDLSKKSNSSKSAPSSITFPSIKSEPEELEIPAEAHKHAFKNGNSKVNVKPNPGETAIYPEVKTFQKDTMELTPLHVSTASSKLMINIKSEPGLEFDS